MTEEQVVNVRGEDVNSVNDHGDVKVNGVVNGVGALDLVADNNGAESGEKPRVTEKNAVSNGEGSETATVDVVSEEGELKLVDSQNGAGSVQNGVVVENGGESANAVAEELVTDHDHDNEEYVVVGASDVQNGVVAESDGDVKNVSVNGVEECEISGGENGVVVNQSDREFEGVDVHNDVVVVTATTDESGGDHDVQGRSESISDKDVDKSGESENVVSADVSVEDIVTVENHDEEEVVEKNEVPVDFDVDSVTTDVKECEPEDAGNSLDKGQVEPVSDVGVGIQNSLAELELEACECTKENEIAVDGEPGSKLEMSKEEAGSELVPEGENLVTVNCTDVIGDGDVVSDIGVESKGEPSVEFGEIKSNVVDSSGERSVYVCETKNGAVDSEAEPSNCAVQSESKPSVVSEMKNNGVESEAAASNGAAENEAEPSNGAIQSEAEPSNDVVPTEAEASNGAVDSEAKTSNGAVESEAEPSNGAVESEAPNGAVESEAAPPNGAAESEAAPPNGAVESEAQPSNGAVESEAYPSNGVVNSEAEPSNGAVESEAEPSNGALESEAKPSNGAVESEAEPSTGTVESEAEPSNGAVESEAEPSTGAVESEAEPSTGAVESEAEPSTGAVESEAEPSNGAVKSEAEPSNDAVESEAEPSKLNGVVESEAEPSTSNGAVVSDVEPSNGAVQTDVEPSNDAVPSDVESSNGSVKSEAEPSNGVVKSEAEPSNGAVKREAEPSNGTVPIEIEPSVDMCDMKNNAVESRSEPSVVCENKNNLVSREAVPSSGAVQSKSESSVVSEIKNNAVESETEHSKTAVEIEAEPSVEVSEKKAEGVESEAEPSVEGGGSSQGDEVSRSASDLDGQNVGSEVVRKPFYYLIRVPRYDDDENIKEQIKNALHQVEEKTKIRDAIRAESQTMKASCKDYDQEFKAAIAAGRAARDLLKSKRQEMDSVQSTMNRLNNAISVGDIDGKIRNMEHMIEHETLPLNEEKQLIRQIKQLKQNREELSASMRKQDQSQQSLDEKDNIEEHYKRLQLLKKEMEVLRNNVLKSEATTKAAKKKYTDECDKLNLLLTRFKAADDIRQEAYAKLHALKKQLHEKSKNFWEYKNASNKAQELAAAGKKEELQCFCVDQVERIMELWNKNDDFRKDYVRCNTRSTLKRLQTFDGRSLGPDEEAPVIPSFITERALKTNSTTVSQSTLEEEKKPTSAEAVNVKDEPASKVVVQKNETNKTTKPKKHTKPVPLEKPVARWADESDEDQDKKEEPVRTKEEEEQILKAEKARKEEEEAKLKEKRRLEEIEKAKEAQQRKMRNAEKARQRAALKAQKEAEQREKEREKRAKKKERRKAASAAVTAEDAEQESAPTSETLTRSTEESDQSEKPAEITKKLQKPSQFTRQTKAKSVPLAIRNRGKRRIQPWMWVLIAVMVVVALFFLGNSSYLRSSLEGFGF